MHFPKNVLAKSKDIGYNTEDISRKDFFAMTIKDLAAQTGYSVGTVSRVLNNQPHVSEAAREVILQAAAESGFELNTNAKQLKQQRSKTILVICRGTANELFGNMLVSIQARIGQTGYRLSVDYIDEDANEVRRAIRLCLEKKPQGILFLGGNRRHFLEDFHQIQVPCVLVTNDARDLPFRNLSSVSSDDILAAEMAIDHLASLGHRKIGVIGGHWENSYTAELRAKGCRKAFEKWGIPFTDAEYEAVRFSYEDGYRATKALLERNPGMTAVFATADVIAIGAMRAITDLGLRIPEDISLVGLDGLAMGDYTVPRLTTVAQSTQALVDRALALLAHYANEKAGAICETVPVTLQVKESTKAL